jgi:hypothetical protein
MVSSDASVNNLNQPFIAIATSKGKKITKPIERVLSPKVVRGNGKEREVQCCLLSRSEGMKLGKMSFRKGKAI